MDNFTKLKEEGELEEEAEGEKNCEASETIWRILCMLSKHCSNKGAEGGGSLPHVHSLQHNPN